MKLIGIVTPVLVTAALLVAGDMMSSRVLAQDHRGHASVVKGQGASAFVKIVRESTERFRDPEVAKAENYLPMFGCVSGSHEGAMGVHFVNFPYVADGVFDVTRPELLVYEPLPNGRMRLVAADYLVLADQWNEANTATPELMGQLFHYFESPNRFGLAAFYTLHVWAWKENPQGMFANWNPNVSCEAYEP
jgi:hypothetical protein